MAKMTLVDDQKQKAQLTAVKAVTPETSTSRARYETLLRIMAIELAEVDSWGSTALDDRIGYIRRDKKLIGKRLKRPINNRR